MSDGVYTWRGYSSLPEGADPFTEKKPSGFTALWALVSMGAVMLAMVVTGALLKKRTKRKEAKNNER